ncbi:hypothetical protein D3C78_1200170 [compost metagenome]
MAKGTTVQRISTQVCSWNCAAWRPWLRRCMSIDQNIAPNTSTPMTTQIQKMIMCRSNTERLTSVAPGPMFTAQFACAGSVASASAAPSEKCESRNIPGPLVVLVIPPASCLRSGREQRLAATDCRTLPRLAAADCRQCTPDDLSIDRLAGPAIEPAGKGAPPACGQRPLACYRSTGRGGDLQLCCVLFSTTP